jgi:hypothetical protein
VSASPAQQLFRLAAGRLHREDDRLQAAGVHTEAAAFADPAYAAAHAELTELWGMVSWWERETVFYRRAYRRARRGEP